MSWEVHIDWRGQTCLVGRLHAAGRREGVVHENVMLPLDAVRPSERLKPDPGKPDRRRT